ncbi:hypothetical protein [Brasilonema bromeliae]|uniref:hypothetical protein n=1 Tax=Brasilonema bromeliae TaxID=383615 RepID=UPI00145D5870|nr:hypothetical protein [Brasilonema bromeliae]
MALFCRLLIVALLVYGVISGDIHLNDPVLIPVLIELVNSMDRSSKSDDEH